MADHVFKGITIVGTSNESFSQATEAALERVKQTLRQLRWFRVCEQRGAVVDGRVEYQVTLEVFFRLESGEATGT